MKIKAFLIILAISFPISALSEEASKYDAALGLLESMNMAQSYQKMIEQITDTELEKNPAMMPYKHIMLDFFEKYLGYENIKYDLATIYAEEFTREELLEITKFYKTAAGQKTVAKMPELMTRGGEVGLKKVQYNIAELQNNIRAEAERIQALQNQ